MHKLRFSMDELIDLTEIWLTQGDLHVEMLAEQFRFISPYWQSANRAEFVDKFKHSSIYKDTSLVNIIKFDPIIKFKSDDLKHFSIILQYHTKNGTSVYEAILATVNEGLLTEIRTIYDLEATKKAHQL